MELFQTGVILKPRGLRGEVKVEIVTDFPESFLYRKEYFAGRAVDVVEKLSVKKAVLSAGFAWLMFDGVDSVEKAELLIGWGLFVDACQLMPQPKNRAYLHEIIGMKILDRDRCQVGLVTNVIRMPAHEVYEVLVGVKRALMPAIEEFVEEFNLEERFIVIPRYDEFL